MTLADALALVVLRSRSCRRRAGRRRLRACRCPRPRRARSAPSCRLRPSMAPSGAVSGPDHAIAALEAVLAARDIEARRLKIAVAAHSAVLDPILDEFRAGVRKMKLSPPTRRFISNLTGTWADAKEVTTAEDLGAPPAPLRAVRRRHGDVARRAYLRVPRGRPRHHALLADAHAEGQERDPRGRGLLASPAGECRRRAVPAHGARSPGVGKNPDWSKLRGPAKRQRLCPC